MKPVRQTITRERESIAIYLKYKASWSRKSVTLENVDCSVEGSQFHFCSSLIECAKKRIPPSRHKVMLVSGRRQLGFVHDFSLQRRGAHIEGVRRRKPNLDDAAVIF